MGFEDKVDEEAIRQSIKKRDFDQEKLVCIPSLKQLEKMMEEMANAPREEFGKREPGERCMYEIQRMGREQGKEI